MPPSYWGSKKSKIVIKLEKKILKVHNADTVYETSNILKKFSFTNLSRSDIQLKILKFNLI